MDKQNEQAVPALTNNSEEALEGGTTRLMRLIYNHAPHDGTFSLRMPGLYIGRYSRIDTNYIKTFYMPLLGIIVQGARIITVGKEVYQADKWRMLMLPVPLPVTFQTTHASHSEPFINIRLDLDPQRIAELALKVFPQGLPVVGQRRAVYTDVIDTNMINALTRLMESLLNPGEAQLLAPLVMEEIFIRLLRSPIGVRIAEIGFADSSIQQITEAIAWLRNNYAQQMKVAELAEFVHMSVSSFHEHFKTITTLSPLQYQKTLRLQEARRLILTNQMDATTACRQVGYVSSSQFSRDYSNFFGNPPRRDIAGLRQKDADNQAIKNQKQAKV